MTQEIGQFKQARLDKELLSVGQALPFDVFAKNGFLLMKKGYYILTDEQKAKLVHMVNMGNDREITNMFHLCPAKDKGHASSAPIC